jgi:hypothetical protein
MQRMIAGRVVVDRTGLTGNYSLRLPYSPPSLSADAGAPPADSVSTFTAARAARIDTRGGHRQGAGRRD